MSKVASALSELNKKFGNGTIMKWGEKPDIDVSAFSTNCLSIDNALGVGGFPKGRIIEVYGPESSGKTTLALQVAATAQREGGIVAYVDAEHALDPEYAKKLNVNVDELLISQPDCGEQALEIVDSLVSSGEVAVVVIDSVAALVPMAEINGEMGDSHVGLQARLMSQAMRKLTPSISTSNTCVIFINQLRHKIGVMYGSPEVTTGGQSLKFYASVRMDIRRIGPVKDGDDVVGARTRIKVVKNKVAPPFKEVEFDLIYGEGISRESDLIDLALSAGILTQKASWLSKGDQTLAQGKEKLRRLLKENVELYQEIEAEVKKTLN